MRVLWLALVALVACLVPGASARAQEFFPDGDDYLNYDPQSGPTGRIYVGDASGGSPCHYRYDLPPGKTVTDVELDEEGAEVGITNGEGRVVWIDLGDFESVDAQGQPCDPGGSGEPRISAYAALPPVLVSNDADSFALRGRWAVVVGSNSPTPVSLVDRVANAEVDTFAASAVGTFAAIADDGVTVLALLDGNLFDTSVVRKLVIEPGGSLQDTGLAFPLSRANSTIKKTFAVPGARIGLAITVEFGSEPAARIESFGLDDMQAIDAVQIGGLNDISAAVSPSGHAVYARSNDDVQGWTLDPVTGALGDAPFLSVSGISQAFIPPAFGNALGITRDGARLVVSEPAAFPTPEVPTPRVSYLDATTGARLGFLSLATMVTPTLIATAPEPGGALACASALAGLALLRRRRRRPS